MLKKFALAAVATILITSAAQAQMTMPVGVDKLEPVKAQPQLLCSLHNLSNGNRFGYTFERFENGDMVEVQYMQNDSLLTHAPDRRPLWESKTHERAITYQYRAKPEYILVFSLDFQPAGLVNGQEMIRSRAALVKTGKIIAEGGCAYMEEPQAPAYSGQAQRQKVETAPVQPAPIRTTQVKGYSLHEMYEDEPETAPAPRQDYNAPRGRYCYNMKPVVCLYPTDRDRSGRLCGRRAASVRAGGWEPGRHLC